MTLSEYEMDMTDRSSLIDYCLSSVIDLVLVLHRYTKHEASEAIMLVTFNEQVSGLDLVRNID
jgi:hypothetical protein